MAKTTIILLNWNGWQDTIACLESLMRSNDTDYEVVVCDNASTDDSLNKIKAWATGKQPVTENLHDSLRPLITPPLPKPIRYILYDRNSPTEEQQDPYAAVPLVLIETGANWGYAGGNNVGIRYALTRNTDYIWLLNNDTLVRPDTLTHMVCFMESNPRLGLAGSAIYLATEPDTLQTYGGGHLTPILGTDRFQLTPGPIQYVSGTSLFIRQAVVEEVGLLDEGFFFYWEDTDYSTRAKKRGWLLGTAEKAIVFHKFSASVGGQSLKSDLFKVGSLTRYFKKHGGFCWFFPVLYNVLGMLLKRLWRGQLNRIFPILKETLASVGGHITD